jgi:hypothetical protein
MFGKSGRLATGSGRDGRTKSQKTPWENMMTDAITLILSSRINLINLIGLVIDRAPTNWY